jgi:hypothetical protein
MSVRKLGFAVLTASALLMSLHVPSASAHGRYYRHDRWGWFDNYGNYHRFERRDRWGWYDNDGYYHRFDDSY